MRIYFALLLTLLIGVETALAASEAPHTFAEHSALANGMWVKVSVSGDEDMIRQISYADLHRMGFTHPEKVRVYGHGGHVLPERLEAVEYDDLPQVPTLHDAEHARLLFMSHGLVKWEYDESRGFTHRRNTYETLGFYFLHEDENTAADQQGSTPDEADIEDKAATRGEAQLRMALHESELANIGQTGREKYGESFVNTRKQTFNLGSFGAGEIALRINAIAKTSAASKYVVLINNTEIGSLNVAATTGAYTFATEGWFEKKVTLEAEGELAVTLQFEPGDTKPELARLNFIEAIGPQPADRITRLEDALKQTGTTYPTVKVVGKVDNQDLHALPYSDLVIVTAPAYLSEAERLAAYRRTHDGMSVTVLTPEPIYNEFSSGGQDPTAIRLLMKKMQPRYLLLMGDGHFDNTKIDRQRQLPCYETDYALSETSSCVCDDYFGFIEDGEGGSTDRQGRYQISGETLDLGVGRLPVSNLTQAQQMVDKIIAYSNNRYQGTWKTRLCFLSDDDKEGDSYNAHVRHNDLLVNLLEQSGHREYEMKKIYLPAYNQTSTASGTDYPDARKEFMEALKQGTLMVNYAGHGNAQSITHEMIMSTSIASQLTMRYLPVWVTASCDVGRWDNDDNSMGEELTLNANGGAIAMFTTVRVVYAQQNLSLNQAIIDNLFKRFDDGTRYRLGDILKSAKRALGSDYNKLNFCLMGDPSLTMAFPEQHIAVTEVNGQTITPETAPIKLQALQAVTMKGAVYKTGSPTEIDTSFNGIVFPTLYDAQDTLIANKGYVQDDADPYRFVTRTRKAFSGRGEIREGKFEFTFMVPQDIASSNLTGLATLYACSDEWKEAQGYFSQYSLSGSTSGETKRDTLGPEIRQLFLNDMLFCEGAVVNRTPYFYAEVTDESGFNTTGNSIGHDMVLTLKCISNPLLSTKQYILNNYFTTYTGQYNVGSVQFSIPELEDGEYEATFTVWDIFNNFTRRKFHFTVSHGKAPKAVAVQVTPSPAKPGDKLTFRVLHDRPESETQLRLEVFSASGHCVYTAEVQDRSAEKFYAKDMKLPVIANPSILADETPNFMGSTTVEWTHPTLTPGFYVYRIVLTSPNSQTASESKILIIQQ